MGKRFTIFISVLLLVSLFICSCAGEAVEPTPADSIPPVAEQQADTSPQVNDEPQVTDEPQAEAEPQIPEDYLTYTDESGIFSISYPPEWELLLQLIDISEQDEKDIINSINEDRSVERMNTIFLAGLSTLTGYSPYMVITIEPLHDDTWSIDEVCEFEISGIKKELREYNEISREKTVIDGKEAIILLHEDTLMDTDILYAMSMIIKVDKNVWTVSCGTKSESEYSKWEDDFYSIFRSLHLTTPVEPAPSVTEQQTDSKPQADDEPQIPGDYLSYTNMDETYSISYPQGWQLLLHFLDTMEQDVEGSINSINEGKPVEKTTVIFLAGLPTETVYSPNVTIVVEPNKYNLSNIDDVCESEIVGIKMNAKEYNEIYREKTVVDGKEAMILQYVETMPDERKLYIMNMFVVVDKNIWTVGCGTSSESDYAKWESDFNNIVRSLRILK